ncbi:7167_t:CDS:2 [Racocetra persica]|uniref:7167_t:CDS:1 n=1 Tax=Racocetra persica TaxID=160502 RepID=A0ACA9RGP5_9GLOM|nr:7167_t:CDS:2 [Racocetra persica]
MCILRSGKLFRTDSGRIPTNQQEVLETLSGIDNLSTYAEAVHSAQNASQIQLQSEAS